jgi:hypothetical protein
VKAKTECEVAELSYASSRNSPRKHTELCCMRVGRQMAERLRKNDSESQRPRVPRRNGSRRPHAARS